VNASVAVIVSAGFDAYAKLFLTAFGVTLVATPLVRRFVIRVGVIDQPSDRRVHPKATPTMGGLAMYAGFLAALAVSRFVPFFREVNVSTPEPLAALVGCTLMVGLGAIDDTRGTTPVSKLTAQVFIAGVIVLLGVQFAYFFIPFVKQNPVVLSGDLPVILTIAWVVAVANAVNLVDGLDGLAAGMVAIASSVLFVYIVRSPSLFGEASQAALLSAITAGICLGFLPWNFYPAKIFMGDTGSMLLGMLLAIATISGVGRNFIPPSTDDLVAIAGSVAVLLLVLAVPFLDVALAIVRRTWRGQGIGHADKEHLHHRLMDIGHGHREAVLLMYLWSALISGCGLVVGLITGRFLVGMIIAAAFILFIATAFPRLAKPVNGAHVSVLGNGSDRPADRPAQRPAGRAEGVPDLTIVPDGEPSDERQEGTAGGFPPAAP
jgi:UDP-GlcNAc:undecaprenyl-phosphate/decaprenyl-phosphate GlcNAc-1-phosphate transferase